ncbi:unnamed protein product [Mesocestoides corti]|uniref:Uncharacterized protein n=1 Tax=Mesocestoides corti TaxID=53468 RepID=A0A0R3UJ66_MESCO|nr:unnamed protein product [Mesocestoides corti]
MEQGFEKRRVMRRSSAQFYVSAEDHIKNEMKHERHLTETSRLTSSWASLRLSGNEKHESSDCGFSSPGSSGSSPVSHRPSSFSGPLMISVTCSSSGGVASAVVNESKPSVAISSTQAIVSLSRSSSCYPSPVASPVSSRVQCYSPGIGLATKKRTASVSSCSSASPLVQSSNLGKKRAYNCLQNTDTASSAEGSRESSPEPPRIFSRFGKILRSSEVVVTNVSSVVPTLCSPPRDTNRWTPPVSTPSSPSPILPATFHSVYWSVELPQITCRASTAAGVDSD